MKVKRFSRKQIFFALLCLLLLGVIVLSAAGVSGSKAPVFTDYNQLAQEREWDAKLEKALNVAYNNEVGGILSTIPLLIYQDAYQIVYELGPEAVPYILDKIESSGRNGFDEAFLIQAATYNLQLYETYWPEDISAYADVLPDKEGLYSPQNYAFFLRAFLEEVPDKVDDICDSKQTQEQKLKELDKLGMAALPYLAQRVEKGEAQWEACFENQLLGLTVEGRFNCLGLKAYNKYKHAESGEPLKDYYTLKQECKKAVDVDKWIGDHAVTLDAVQYACER